MPTPRAVVTALQSSCEIATMRDSSIGRGEVLAMSSTGVSIALATLVVITGCQSVRLALPSS
jgi:hypothetical protein